MIHTPHQFQITLDCITRFENSLSTLQSTDISQYTDTGKFKHQLYIDSIISILDTLTQEINEYHSTMLQMSDNSNI
jgi:hypothetical protein